MKLKILLLEDIPTDADIIEVRAKINIISKFSHVKDSSILDERVAVPALKNDISCSEIDLTISLSRITGGYLFAAFHNNSTVSKEIERVLRNSDIEIEGLVTQKVNISAELESKNKEIMILRNEVEKAKLHKLLSKREFEIMCLIASGQSIKEIAEQLFLSPSTVATYRARLMEKLNFKSTIDLVLYAVRNGLIE
ncbi:MAG: response regulator transcription factor [Bacteroidia bacterium]